MQEKTTKTIILQKIITLGVLAILFAFFITLPFIQGKLREKSFSEVENDKTNTEQIAQVYFPRTFEGLKLESQSAIVWDIKNQKPLFEKNSEKIAPLASITKILTATLSYDLLPPNTEIRIEQEFLEAEGDSGLFAEESWKLKDLIDFTLMTSSNDGARAIASISGSILTGTRDFESGRERFVSMMNQKASEIGLFDFLIRDETGLDKNEFQSGSYGTAKDVALLFDYVYKNNPDVFESTKKSDREFISIDQIHHEAENTNTLLNDIPGIIGSKTGFTDLAGGNLGVIFDPSLGRPIVTVVLGSSYDGRFEDTKKLIDATRKYIIEEKTNHR